MRKYRQVVEFANFICHFDNKVLLDYLHEIILPAFLTGKRLRMYGGSKYLLLNVELVDLESSKDEKKVPALVGKFVLDTELRRDQILVDGKLVPSTEQLASAPSSMFVLLLENHKLIYTKEVSGAPGLSAFRTTIELLLRLQRSQYVNELYLANKAARESNSKITRITKKSLFESIPAPTVEIIPLAGSKNLEEFVSQFKLLKEVSIKVVRPNAEINNDGLFNTVETARAQVNADATSLVHRNPDGLNKTQSIKQIAPAMDGNAIITLRGIGVNDAKLAGSNDEISVREPIDISPDVKRGTAKMYAAFKRLVGVKILKLGQVVISKINKTKLESLELGR